MDEEFTNEPSPAPLPSDAIPSASDLPAETALPVEPAPKRGWWRLAWAIIIVMTVLAALGQAVVKETEHGQVAESKIGLILVEMQGRALVGAAHFSLMQESGQKIYEQAKGINTGPLTQRLCFVTLAGELAGPEEARKQLAELDKLKAKHGVQDSMAPSATRVEGILRRLYLKPNEPGKRGPAVSPAERAFLKSELGWYGDLALASSAPAEEREQVLASAERTFLTITGTVLFLVFCGVAGLAGLILMLILFFLGVLRGGLQGGSPGGLIYAETFALWMLLFTGLNVALVFLPEGMPRLPASGGVMLLSLVILAWPVMRGITWRQVRTDIGWTAGRRPLLEPLLGFGCYGMALPLLAIGVVMMLGLLALQNMASGTAPGTDNFGPSGAPAHPIVLAVATGDWWTRLQILVLVAVVAPIVEETMFRGVLYRHLREATRQVRVGWSMLLSATVVSFIFAVVHPQGWIAVPPLMALSYAFCLAREWRGTLVPSMVAHGTNNGLLMLFLMLALGG
jgi:membrane protease YdiL (CAAX protease family)